MTDLEKFKIFTRMRAIEKLYLKYMIKNVNGENEIEKYQIFEILYKSMLELVTDLGLENDYRIYKATHNF